MAKKAAGKSRSKAKTKPAAKGSPPAASTAKARPSEAIKMIGTVDLGNLMRRCLALKKQGKEIAGNMGDLVSSAVENKNLDKPAFDIARKLKGQSPQKRLTTIACLLYYIDVLKLDEAEDGQAELQIARQEAGETETGAGAKETKAAPKNGAATGAAATPTDGPKDLRPPHLRTPAEGGTKIVEDLAKSSGATTTGSAASH